MKFADASGARDCGGDSNCSDRRAAASLGYLKRIAPSIRFISRVPSLKLKIVLAPRRVMVRSAKVNSLRDCVPVRTALPRRTRSLTAAGRGAACSSSSLTSFTTWVTRASCNCAAPAEVAMAIVQVKADAAAMNFVCGVPANSFLHTCWEF